MTDSAHPDRLSDSVVSAAPRCNCATFGGAAHCSVHTQADFDAQQGDPAALTAVRKLHSRRDFSGDGYGWSLCTEDRQQWPCATERAIREALGES